MRSAKTFWDLCEGKVTNLSLNKLLYIAHMMYLGNCNEPLTTREFEAWDYGPVEPDLYHKLKAYGSKSVPDIFPYESFSPDENEYEVIADVANTLGKVRSGVLVSLTHWEHGAWSRVYQQGIRGIQIPNEYVLEEFNLRANEASKKENQPA